MCFGGGGSSPQAPVQTPSTPVDEISAGHPTITVAPNPAQNAAQSTPRVNTPAASQVNGPTGLSM